MFTRISDEIACPTSLPGRPVTCVNPKKQTCPSQCGEGRIPCGLMRREDGQLLVGSDGSPLPNCVAPDSSSALCTQPNFRPLSTSFTGGNSSSSWTPKQIQGTSDNNKANAAIIIASIGSSVLPGSSIPAFYAGNDDPTIVVEVSALLHVAHGFLQGVISPQFVVAPVPDSILQYCPHPCPLFVPS
jgi:hypothetical protein